MWFGCEQPFLWGEHCVTSQKTAAEETKQTENLDYFFRPSRLETGPLVFQGTKSGLGPLGGESVCLLAFDSTSAVLQLEIRPSFGGSGCVFPGLEQSEGI